MDVQFLTTHTEHEWNEFLVRCPDATFYHQIGWKNVLERTYGLKPVYLMATDHDEISGILPLFLIESKIFGDKLISLPYAPYGGIASLNENARKMIFEEVKSFAKDRDVKYIEFKNFTYQSLESSIDRSYVTVLLQLTRDTTNIWSGLRKSMRRYVKKSMENKLELSLNSHDLPAFHSLYSKHMHYLGSPVHGYDFFRNISAEFPENSQIATVYFENIPISSIFLLNFKDSMIYGWGASNNEFLGLYPNYLLFWETIKSCAERDFKIFDFGKSLVNEGTYAFKIGWGAEPKQLFYQRYPPGKRYSEIQKTNMKRRIFTRIWKSIPDSCANILGPIIRREFP